MEKPNFFITINLTKYKNLNSKKTSKCVCKIDKNEVN